MHSTFIFHLAVSTLSILHVQGQCTLNHSAVLNEGGTEVEVIVTEAQEMEGQGYLNLNFTEGKLEDIDDIKAWCVDVDRTIWGDTFLADIFSSMDKNESTSFENIYPDAVDKFGMFGGLNWMMNNRNSGSVIDFPSCASDHTITDQEFQLATWRLMDNHNVTADGPYLWTGDETQCVVDDLVQEAEGNQNYALNCNNPDEIIGLVMIIDRGENTDSTKINRQVVTMEVKLVDTDVCNCPSQMPSTSQAPTTFPSSMPSTAPVIFTVGMSFGGFTEIDDNTNATIQSFTMTTVEGTVAAGTEINVLVTDMTIVSVRRKLHEELYTGYHRILQSDSPSTSLDATVEISIATGGGGDQLNVVDTTASMTTELTSDDSVALLQSLDPSFANISGVGADVEPPPTASPSAMPSDAPTTSPSSPPTALSPPTIAPAGVYGDPHFMTWAGERFDFHGVCDLVFMKNLEFGNGLGMDIHMRTKRMGFWSFVSNVAIRIGNDILEIVGIVGDEDRNNFWINGILGEDTEISKTDTGTTLKSTISGFPINFKRSSTAQQEFVIHLDDNTEILITTWKAFVSVHVKNGKYEHFQNSVGLMGSFPGGLKLARNKNSVIDDFDNFGQEWQVLASEQNLFRYIEGPQHPSACEIPSSFEMRRRLGESTITFKQAREACSNVNQDLIDLCVFDVMATNDESTAAVYFAERKQNMAF